MDIEESNKDYKEQKKLILDYLDSQDWKSTPTVAEKTQQSGISWNYWRHQLCPALLNYLLENNKVQLEKRPEGGEFTHYWRLEK